MDSVASGLGTEIDDGVPHAGRLGVENRVGACDADRHGVDEDVAVVARMEADRAPNSRHAERVAVMADPRHHSRNQPLGLGMVRGAEAQQVEAGDGARAHCEPVPQDAADACRRPLIGLDVGGVVVALHLEHAGVAIADVDDARILARPLDDPWRRGRQAPQMLSRRFVRALLVPHRRDDAQLRKAWGAADEGDECGVFVGLQAVRDGQRFVDGRFLYSHSPPRCAPLTAKGRDGQARHQSHTMERNAAAGRYQGAIKVAMRKKSG